MIALTINWQTRIAVQGPRGPTENQRIYGSQDLQVIQHYQDKTNEAIMVLELNTDVLTSLRNFYTKLADNGHLPFEDICQTQVNLFCRQIDELLCDAKMQINRARLIARITLDRRDLVMNIDSLSVVHNVDV